MMRFILVLGIVAGTWGGGVQPASAQGLIWSLPEDGTWVRFEGTYSQEEFRPDSADPNAALNLQIEWIRHLTLKSVGEESVEVDGTPTPCRWIEIKVVTGKSSETGIDPGPVGTRLYKVLIPESRVVGRIEDDDQVLVSYLPIVKGYRQVGDNAPEELTSGGLQVYPTISLLTHFRQWDEEDEAASELDVPAGTVPARRVKGSLQMESTTNRSSNESELWLSDDVPFGLAKWSVRLIRETKDNVSPRSSFQRASEVVVEMSAHEIGTGAESELIVPDP